MIQPLNMPQLSSAKPRCGLQSISDLLPRLMRQYELQAELMQRRSELAQAKEARAVAPRAAMAGKPRQATFSWYE